MNPIHPWLIALAMGCEDDKASTPNSEACIGEDGQPLPEAPLSARVDLDPPVFSNPTAVHNPLFPISDLASAVLLGHVEGLPFHTETTLLGGTQDIDLGDGQVVTVLLSQYTSWLGGRVEEVALDHYAQADDGAVWYLGEDVSDFEDGVPYTHEGTWLAGVDGPAAMIMPGDPHVGDAFNTENVCPDVWEQVTITETDVDLEGPNGVVSGAIVGQELHTDGITEDKYFAPGYGEFWTADHTDLEAMAVAYPTDSLDTSDPDLEHTHVGALAVFDAVAAGDWKTANAEAAGVVQSWNGVIAEGLPPMFAQSPASSEVVTLRASVLDGDDVASRRAAVHVARWAWDLELRHHPPPEVDTARLGLWAREVLVDVEDGDDGGVVSDVTSAELVRARLDALDPELLAKVDGSLADLRAAADAADWKAATTAATALLGTLGT
jgi:hypothetical protein